MITNSLYLFVDGETGKLTTPNHSNSVLPQTGEDNHYIYLFLGAISLSIMFYYSISKKKLFK